MSNRIDLYERNQRQKILSAILWFILIATFVLGAINLQYRTWLSVITLFLFSALCIPMLVLNARGHTMLSASFVSLLALIVINVNLYDGDGVRDFGLLAYPIFIMIGALFFGRRSVLIFTLASVASVMVITLLEGWGFIHPTLSGPVKGDDLITIFILFGLAATIVWVMIRTMENNIKQLKVSEAELLDTYELTLEAWAKVMELRDRETTGHSRRLVELSTRLAQAMGCTEKQIAELRRGALLHDIGKLGVPDSILHKPGALDEHDRQVIEKHPGLAKDILSDIPFLQPSMSVIYSHHEHWDGKGYPQGLKGDAIPLLARIFTVVDNWDALSADRVYRPAWPREKIVEYLKANAGSIFDPQVVEVFLQII